MTDGDPGTRHERGDARVEVVVHGRVHGVGFRVFILRRAKELGLTGWVANEPGGRVRWVAEGPRSSLAALVDASRAGPPSASVDDVRDAWSEANGDLRGFEIRSGWHGGD